MREGARLTAGPVPRQLLRLAAPMAVGMLAIIGFNLVDTWFVSRLGTVELAAMSLTFPVVAVIGSLGMGVGVGVTSVVSRAIGGGAQGAVARLTTDALVLALCIVLVVGVSGWLSIDPLFRLLGADAQTLPLVRAYMRIWYLGTVFVVVAMVGMAAIRATGDTRTPAAIMLFAGIVNAVLDPVLIFGFGPVPALGLEGAAIATVLSRSTTLVVALGVLAFRERILTARFEGVGATLDSWRRILRIGGPAAATSLAQPLTIGLLTGLVARFGHDAAAAFGAGARVEMLAMIPVLAIGIGMTPFIGQNWGAGQRGRVAESLRIAMRAAMAIGLVGWGVLALLAHPIAGLFSAEPAVVALAARYLRIVPLAHGLLGLFFIANNTFNALGRPLSATALTLLRAPLLMGGLGFLGARLGGVEGVFVGMAAATGLAGVAAWAATRPLRRPGAAPEPAETGPPEALGRPGL